MNLLLQVPEEPGCRCSIGLQFAAVSLGGALKAYAVALAARSSSRRRAAWQRVAGAIERAQAALAEAGTTAQRRAREG